MCLINKRQIHPEKDLTVYKVLACRGGRYTSPLFDYTYWYSGVKHKLTAKFWVMSEKDDFEYQMQYGCGFHSFKTLDAAKQWVYHWEHAIKKGFGKVAYAKCHIPATADFVYTGRDQDTKIPAVVSSELIMDEII